MLKKILLIIAVIIVGLVIFFNWFKKDTKKHSPPATAVHNFEDLSIVINYCKPSVKERIIFGNEEAGALQPYGKYWRLGANEATTFENNQTIWFNDKELKAGKYAIYAYPGAEKWVIAVNKEWDRWGAQEADNTQDVLRTEVIANNKAPFKEQFEISFSEGDSIGKVNLQFHWDRELITVPIRKK
jgi:hypothetical protein